MENKTETVFNVIWYDINKNKFEPYNVLPHFINSYNKVKNKRKSESKESFKQWVLAESMYHFWSRCEYEILLSDWPSQTTTEKWDIHAQIVMNIDTIVGILSEKFKIK